jgi:hypothetical protein
MREQRQPKEESAGQTFSGSPSDAKGGGRNFCFWVAMLAMVVAMLLHQSLFEGKGLVSSGGIFNFPPWLAETNKPTASLLADQYLVFIPQHEYTHREFMQGHCALWDPNLDCGKPNVAALQGALLFPINLLLLPLDPFYSSGIGAFLKLFLAGLFTMLYLRLLGASDSGAFLSGLVFSLSGFLISWLNHPHINSAVCLPMLIYLIEKSFQSGGYLESPAALRGLRVWAWLGIGFGCLLLGGHPPTIIQVAGFVAIYFLFRLAGQPKSEWLLRAALAGGAVVLGLCLAAPQLLPFLEYYRHSSMNAASLVLDRAATWSTLNTLILYLFPHLNGSPSEGFEDTMLWLGIGKLLPNFCERTGYVGVLPLLFALCAIVLRRSRWIVFYVLTIVVCMLAAYGMPPFPSLFQLFPITKDINPERLILIAGFGVAVLAGLGWDSFYRLESRRMRLWLVAGFWAVIGIILLEYWHKVEPMWKYLNTDHRSFLEPQVLMMLGSLAASGALLLPSMRQHWKFYSMIGLGWVAVDMLNFGLGVNPAIPHRSYYPATPAIEWLQQDKSDFRILGENMVLAPNTPELYGLKDVRGYDFTVVRQYEELIQGKVGTFFFYRSAESLPLALPLLGVKYVLTFNSPALDPALFELVYSNEINIYRYRHFLGRALTVFDYSVDSNPASVLSKVRSGSFDPKQTLLLEQPPPNASPATQPATAGDSSARVVSEQPDEVDVEASMARAGFLLLLDTYFPGWKATVNGVEAPVLRADYNFRAVQLPAGKSTIRFVYQPESFRLGLILCLAGLAVSAVVILGSRWGRGRRINNPVSSATKRHT